MSTDTDGAWIDTCCGQLGLRWTALKPALAMTLATGLAKEPSWRSSPPADAADGYVRTIECEYHVHPGAFTLTFTGSQGDGISADLGARAAAAAQEVIAAAGISPAAAAQGWFLRDAWDDCGFAQQFHPTPAQGEAAEVWDRARGAALTVAGVDYTFRGPGLELRWNADVGRNFEGRWPSHPDAPDAS